MGEFPRRVYLCVYDDGAFCRDASDFDGFAKPACQDSIPGSADDLLCGHCIVYRNAYFNPYHLTNLTHTFEISISKHAESWRSVNEWRPAFDFMDKTRTSPNPVGEEEAFGVMCIVLIIAFVVWIIAQNLRPRIEFDKKTSLRMLRRHYQGWPKIDLPMLAVALFTTYMAVQSRRFIAIAGPAACPVIFLLIQQAWQAVTAQIQYRRN